MPAFGSDRPRQYELPIMPAELRSSPAYYELPIIPTEPHQAPAYLAELQRAPARASWPCRFCGQMNPASTWTCEHCRRTRRRRARPSLAWWMPPARPPLE
jgi:hypothetical protein